MSETSGRVLTPDPCVACGHDMAHHDQPDCWECSNIGTVCQLAEDLIALADSVCEKCNGDLGRHAYNCPARLDALLPRRTDV